MSAKGQNSQARLPVGDAYFFFISGARSLVGLFRPPLFHLGIGGLKL
jgi:hypothetical protein